MKFNTKTRYGLRTMLELALNENGEEGIFQKDIAENQNVSIKYLDQIIAALKAAGLIANVGGKKSGYKLNRPAKDISVYDIYTAFEEELVIIDCLLHGGHCPNKQKCVMRDYWSGLNQTIRSSMESMSIKELASQHKDSDVALENSNS
jgi:Rrf2 family protein